MIIVLFGAPGVGKGTQAEILASKLGISHLSTGAAFRTAISEETPVGLLAKDYVSKGALVPDEITAKIVEEALGRPEFAGGCILDGFPRTQVQAEALDALLSRLGRSIDHVVTIDVADDLIINRLLQRGRSDDTEDVIRHRLGVYMNETQPLLRLYGDRGLVTSVDGVGAVEEVNQRILAALGK